MTLDELLSDREHGSEHIAYLGAELMLECDDVGEMLSIARTLADAFPTMAILKNLLSRISRSPSRRTLLKFLEMLDESQERIIEKALRILPDNPVVATISRSGTVEGVLGALPTKMVYVSESLPGGEGKGVAEELYELVGYSVELIADTAWGLVAPDVDVFLVGADALLPDSFINKVGTLEVALVAQHFEKPFYVAATSLKRISSIELEKGRNALFETIPNELVQGFITDE